MDKRYFLIVIIICICGVNLFMISNFSDVVGSAYVDVGDYTFSLPKGFTLYSDQGSYSTLINQNSDMQIVVDSYLGKNDTFSNKINEINRRDDYHLYSNGTINYRDIKVDSAFYHSDSENRSTFYFNEDGNNFRIIIMGFDYNSQKDEVIDIALQIIGSIRVNYKLSA